MLFMLAGPDYARMVDIEAIHDRPTAIFHRSSRGGTQLASDDPKGYIILFHEGIWQLGNPFVATSLELVALDTQNVMEESVVASLSEIREVGQTLHAVYVRESLEDSSVPISDIIKRNNMLTFANRPEMQKKAERMSAYNDIT